MSVNYYTPCGNCGGEMVDIKWERIKVAEDGPIEEQYKVERVGTCKECKRENIVFPA